MSKIRTDRIGKTYLVSNGDMVEIIEYFSNRNITLLFSDGTITKNNFFSSLKRGSIKNPNHLSVYGVGYIGQGVFKHEIGKKSSKSYHVWASMMRRGYDEKYQEKYPTYKDVIVCEEWHNFQNFAKWYCENYNQETMKGWHLDKDILMKGNKIYSPETCCFVPQEINHLFTLRNKKKDNTFIGVYKRGSSYQALLSKRGKLITLGSFDTPEEAFQVYKTAKEEYIKEVAEEWKSLIDLKVYQAMYDYKVEIIEL